MVGVSSQINYYEKKAIDQRVRYTQKQCAVLSDQIVMNGFRNYNMSSLSDEAGENVFEVEQLANNLEGRILLVDSRFKILADTYNRNCGKYLVTKETIHAMKGEEVAYRYIGKQYLQVITPIQDKNNDKSDVRGLIIAMVSLQNCNEMSEYLYDQRDNLVGIFFINVLIHNIQYIRYLVFIYFAVFKAVAVQRSTVHIFHKLIDSNTHIIPELIIL